jgi:predicted amidophosphoribosyltransferase
LWENEIKGKIFLSLFSWEQDQNLILNQLIMNLKGSKQERAYKYYGKIIATKLSAVISKADNWLICPCPSWNYQKDHAYYLAKALSEELGISLAFPLSNGIRKTESKELSKSERLNNVSERFIINNGFFEKFTGANETHILFVDDVITTGATLLAASEKLKDFKQIIGISLAFRR